MKALTLWNPWAYGVAHLGKPIENRTWAPPPRLLGERIAIHAGKTNDREACDELALEGFTLPASMPSSAIVCTVRIVAVARGDGDCFQILSVAAGVARDRVRVLIEARDGLWFSGPIGWVLDEVRIVASPVVCRGAQGLWDVPVDIERAVLAQEAKAA